MVDSDEEFEDLFDYKRVQPLDFVSIDDDSDTSLTHTPKRRKVSRESKTGAKVKVGVEVVDCDDGDEEDDILLLSPPPMILGDLPKCNSEDSIIKELRKRKEELASFAKSTQDILRTIDEPAGADSSLESSSGQAVEKPSETKPSSERAKVVICIQDKGGQKQFRIFVDEKFERLFKMYSEKVKIDMELLAFSFDGEKVSPSSTPASLDMEDEDIIEVHVKSRGLRGKA